MASFVVLTFLLCQILMLNSSIAENLLCTQSLCNNYRLDPGCPAVSQQCVINNATFSGELLPSTTICNCCETCLIHISEGEECSLGGLGGVAILTNRCGYGLSCQSVNDNIATCQRIKSPCHDGQDSWDQRRLAGNLGSTEPRPRCDGSGKYAPNICIPGKTCFCVDQDGNRIFGEALYRDSNQETRMNCACSRLHVDIETKISSAVTRRPTGPRCIADGSFNPIQCSGDICYCIDTATGTAIPQTLVNTTITEISRMDCFNSNTHLSNTTYRTLCEEVRDHQRAMLDMTEEQGFTAIGSVTISCQPDGGYESIRISGNRKICVDDESTQIEHFGANLGSDAEHFMDCKCARTLNLMTHANLSFERPACCSNGNYRQIQCRRGFCYCVNPDGVQVGKEVRDTNVDQLACFTDRWREC